MNLLDPTAGSVWDQSGGLDPLQANLDQFAQSRPPQQGPMGGILSALRGVDPTTLMMLGSHMLAASGPMPGHPGFGQRLGMAVNQAVTADRRDSVDQRTAELAQTKKRTGAAIACRQSASRPGHNPIG